MPETGPTEFYAPQSGGTVIGDSQDNLLFGSDGMDHLDGEAGSDTLIGGARAMIC
ncbi:hypothetical protein [Pseudophaeobacter leonis]|uniref:hypothetical protein n=1 Tax=Pseudophaeobacter leonis TaxID=1144477 RepID=UPI0013748063|nr:hypothetical protein [Pseudophaeobacter leonis]